jgi:hypothetical protein
MSRFTKIESKIVRGHLIEAWFDSSRNELIYRKYKKRGTKFTLVDEELYTLNHPIEFKKAFDRFRKYKIFNKKAEDGFAVNMIDCKGEKVHYYSEDLVNDSEAILDVLYKENFNEALPAGLIKKGSNSVLMNTKLLGKSHPVIVTFGKKGDLSNVAWANPKRAKNDGLIISPKTKRLDNRSTQAIFYKDPHSDELKPLVELSTYQFSLGDKGKETKLSVRVRGGKNGL